MDITQFIDEASEQQNAKVIHDKREKLKKQKEQEKRTAQWDRVRAVKGKLENDLKDFIDVKINPYMSHEYRGVWSVGNRNRKMNVLDPKSDSYSSKTEARFTAKNGDFCANIVLMDEHREESDNFRLQVQLNPKTDKIKYVFINKFYIFDDAEQWLGLKEGRGWQQNPLIRRENTFNSYKAAKEHILAFIKATVNIDSLKEKHGLENHDSNKSNVLKIG